MNFDEKYLRQVVLASDVYISCLQHAFSTEKEEIMGLLLGTVDEANQTSRISAYMILNRIDKQPDRVEISAEQLATASDYADELKKKLKKDIRVMGWYHSHPHITVWPSHVDVRTQVMYQIMDPYFVGLIFSVFQKKASANQVQLTCFQAVGTGSGGDHKRREVELIIENTPMPLYNCKIMANLPRILFQEEIQSHSGEGDDETNNLDHLCEDKLAILHNDAFKTVAMVHMISKVAGPLCEAMEEKILTLNKKIEALEFYKNELTTE